jgi:hypothetical protein
MIPALASAVQQTERPNVLPGAVVTDTPQRRAVTAPERQAPTTLARRRRPGSPRKHNHRREQNCRDPGDDRNQDRVRADVDAADASQGTIDEGKERPSAGASTRWGGGLGRLRLGRNRNGIVHG